MKEVLNVSRSLKEKGNKVEKNRNKYGYKSHEGLKSPRNIKGKCCDNGKPKDLRRDCKEDKNKKNDIKGECENYSQDDVDRYFCGLGKRIH